MVQLHNKRTLITTTDCTIREPKIELEKAIKEEIERAKVAEQDLSNAIKDETLKLEIPVSSTKIRDLITEDDLNNLMNKIPTIEPIQIEDKFLATVACKAAVKAHMALTKEEVDSLMKQLLKLPNPFSCPHGRPTIISMNKQEIENLKFEADKAEREGDYGKVAEIRYGKLKALEDEINHIQEDLKHQQGDSAMIKEEVTAEDIAMIPKGEKIVPVLKKYRLIKE